MLFLIIDNMPNGKKKERYMENFGNRVDPYYGEIKSNQNGFESKEKKEKDKIHSSHRVDPNYGEFKSNQNGFEKTQTKKENFGHRVDPHYER